MIHSLVGWVVGATVVAAALVCWADVSMVAGSVTTGFLVGTTEVVSAMVCEMSISSTSSSFDLIVDGSGSKGSRGSSKDMFVWIAKRGIYHSFTGSKALNGKFLEWYHGDTSRI